MTTKETQTPAGRSRLRPLLAAAVLLGLGAAGAYGAVASGMVAGGTGGTSPDQDEPRLLRKGEDDPYAPAAKDADAADGVDGEGGSEYRTRYHRFEDSFTANLAGSPSLIQVELAASTRRDGRVLQWLARHELALRSAILVELAQTTPDAADSVAGKAALQKRLTAALNRVLTEAEGFGGVDQVHFVGYLVQ